MAITPSCVVKALVRVRPLISDDHTSSCALKLCRILLTAVPAAFLTFALFLQIICANLSLTWSIISEERNILCAQPTQILVEKDHLESLLFFFFFTFFCFLHNVSRASYLDLSARLMKIHSSRVVLSQSSSAEPTCSSLTFNLYVQSNCTVSETQLHRGESGRTDLWHRIPLSSS